jgi:hypothetical protein
LPAMDGNESSRPTDDTAAPAYNFDN